MTQETFVQDAKPFFLKGNHIGVLVCHGFSGSPNNMRYLADQLHGAGYTVSAPLLKGHGVSPQAMAGSTASDWIDSVDEAIAELSKHCSEIYMVGQSMGGTLTLFMAATHGAVVKGAVTINAAVRLSRPDLASLAFGRGLPETVPGVSADIKDTSAVESSFSEVPTTAFRQLYSLVAVTHDLLPRVTCPTLVITAREDHVVNPDNGRIIASRVGANRVEMAWLDNSYHIATMDYDKALVAKLAIDFIRSIEGN